MQRVCRPHAKASFASFLELSEVTVQVRQAIQKTVEIDTAGRQAALDRASATASQARSISCARAAELQRVP
jgi:hypothetical protein